MIQGFYTASTALNYRQKGMNIIADNIANVNTPTFKSSSPRFNDALYTAHLKEHPDNQNTHFQTGSGAYISDIQRNMKPGVLTKTNNYLDIAVEKEGFIALVNENGETAYTRGGTFSLKVAPEGRYLTDANGYSIRGTDGNPILIPFEANEIKIDLDGNVIYEGQIAPQRISKVSFQNPDKLEALGGGLYSETYLSLGPEEDDIIKIRQGFLEMSNTDIAKEMSDLIKYQRIFQMNARVISTIDEMQSLANKLRR